MSCALHWTWSSLSVFPLYWGTQTWTECSKKRGIITFLNLLAMQGLCKAHTGGHQLPLNSVMGESKSSQKSLIVLLSLPAPCLQNSHLRMSQQIPLVTCQISGCVSSKYTLLHLWQQIFKYLLIWTNIPHSTSCVYSALPDKLAPTSSHLLSKEWLGVNLREMNNRRFLLVWVWKGTFKSLWKDYFFFLVPKQDPRLGFNYFLTPTASIGKLLPWLIELVLVQKQE